MHTQHHEIGETAGKIYKALEKSAPQTTNALSKEIDVNDTALFNQALGWLAREGNVNFEKKGALLEVSLIKTGTCCG